MWDQEAIRGGNKGGKLNFGDVTTVVLNSSNGGSSGEGKGIGFCEWCGATDNGTFLPTLIFPLWFLNLTKLRVAKQFSSRDFAVYIQYVVVIVVDLLHTASYFNKFNTFSEH